MRDLGRGRARLHQGYDGIVIAPDHQGGHGQSAEVFAAEPHAGSEAAWGDQRTELGQVGLGRDRVPGARDERVKQAGEPDPVTQTRVRKTGQV